MSATTTAVSAARLSKRILVRDGSRDAIATLVALGDPALPCVGSLLQRLAPQRTARAGRIRWFVAIELTREWSHQARFERAAVAAMLAASLKRARSNAQRSSWIAADAIIDLLGTHALPVLDDVLRTAGRVGRAAAVTAMLRFVFEGRLNKRLAALPDVRPEQFATVRVADEFGRLPVTASARAGPPGP